MASRAVTAAVIAVVATAGLSACSGNSPEGEADPTPTHSVSPSQTTAVPSSASPTTGAPTVQPAQGQELKLPTVSMRLPAAGRWRTVQVGNSWGASQRRKPDFSRITVSLSNIKAVTDDIDIDAESTLKVENKPWLKRGENRVIDGAECWVIEGRDAETHTFMVGGVAGDRQFSVVINVPLTWADGDQLIEQMLASVQVTDPVG